jgi:phage host-nuclease inhibitor protein Gam
MGRKPEGQAEKMFKRFGKNVDSFIADLNDVKENSSDEFKVRLEELKKSTHSLNERFKDFREQNKDKWEDAQSELERAGQEFKKAVNNLFAGRRDN